MKIVILAGGKGSRLWPLSQECCPKPLLRLGGMHSLLQKTLLRFLGTYDPSSIVVVTSKHLALDVREQCVELDPKGEISILLEPTSRSTAPALALAICFLQEEKKIDLSEPILVVPSDGIISSLDNFLDKIFSSQKWVEEGHIVLLGVVPTKPETSYGYIRLGHVERGFFSKNQFIEKPERELAERLFLEGNVLWNTGHLLISAETFWAENAVYCKEIAKLRGVSLQEANVLFSDLPNISIDYALLEKSKKVIACDMQVSWADLGTWERLYEVFEKDENNNVHIGNGKDLGSKNCFFFSDHQPVISIGLEDVVVVSTQKGIVIAKKNLSHKIGALLESMEEEKVFHE